jgi:hypothetical protein
MESSSREQHVIDINNEITILRKVAGIGQFLGKALQALQDGANTLGTHLGADPTQTIPVPPPIQGLSVKTDGNGNVHAVINDSSSIQKGLNYFVEVQQLAVSAPLTFSQPHVIQLGASRTMPPIPLPALDDNGNAVHYIFQAYSQYQGGQPGAKIRFGGNVPTPILPGGAGRATLLPSTGSGTAENSGTQSGYGFGKQLFRPKVTNG